MKTTSTVCPLCFRSVDLKVVSAKRDAGHVVHIIPTHGHRIARRAGAKFAPKCGTSGFSVEGLAILQSWIGAFGLLANR